MPDANHFWGEKLEVSATGDLALSDGIDLSNQRVIRRLMTILGEYCWHPEYGASVPIRIGDTLDLVLLEGVIREQMALEASVAAQPEPTMTFTPIFSGVFVSIRYTDALTGKQIDLEFEVTP